MCSCGSGEAAAEQWCSPGTHCPLLGTPKSAPPVEAEDQHAAGISDRVISAQEANKRQQATADAPWLPCCSEEGSVSTFWESCSSGRSVLTTLKAPLNRCIMTLTFSPGSAGRIMQGMAESAPESVRSRTEGYDNTCVCGNSHLREEHGAEKNIVTAPCLLVAGPRGDFRQPPWSAVLKQSLSTLLTRSHTSPYTAGLGN